MTAQCIIPSPVGPLLIREEDGFITEVNFTDEQLSTPETELCRRCACQLADYFDHRLTGFDLPLRPEGTPFQRDVWQALTAIPYGEVRSYGDIARAIGRPNACRAVGGANHRNPICIIIPCHRVIGADHTLTGYGGGLDKKTFLLDLEAGKITGDA